MARMEYNDGKVAAALSQLEEAKKELNNVNTEINAGISIIQGARGGNLISANFSSILGLKDTATEGISSVISDIIVKKSTIEEYSAAPAYKKIFATVGMAGSKLVEGIATGGEQLVDGFASLTGMVVGIFSSEKKEAIGEFIKKDHVGDAFAASYKDGILSSIEKYSAFSSTSTAANIFKGVGVAATYVAVAAATGGAAAAIGGTSATVGAAGGVASIGINATIAGIGGLGSGTQTGLQEGKTYNSAFIGGVKQGAVSAGTVVVAGKVAQKLSKATPVNEPIGLPSAETKIAGALGPASVADDATRLIGGTTDDVINSGTKLIGGATDDTLKYTAGTIDDLSRAGLPQSRIDAIKATGAKGYSLSSDGNITLYDSAGKALRSEQVFKTTTTTASTFTDDAVNVGKNASSITNDITDDVININSGKVLNADGTTAGYYATPDATITEKAGAAIKNAGLNLKNAGGVVSDKISNAASAINSKVTPMATNAKEVFKSVGKEIVQNPTAEGIIIGHGINGIRNNNSTPTGTTANFVFDSNIEVKEVPGVLSPATDETTDNGNNSINVSNGSVVTSQEIFNENGANTQGTNASAQVMDAPINDTNIEVLTDTNESIITENNLNSEPTQDSYSNIEPNTNNQSNTYNEYITNNNTNNNEYITNNNTNYNEYITNNEYVTNDTNNYDNSSTNTSSQPTQTITSSNTNSTGTTNTVKPNVTIDSFNKGSAIEPTIKNEQIVNDNKLNTNSTIIDTPIKDSTNNIKPESVTNNYTNTVDNNSSSGSTVKKVLGAVAGVGAVAGAAGLGYHTYKKYENGEFPKKRKEENTEDEYNFVDGEWHDDDE